MEAELKDLVRTAPTRWMQGALLQATCQWYTLEGQTHWITCRSTETTCKMRARVTLPIYPIHSNTLPISSNLSLPEDCPNLDALCNAGLPKSTSVGILKKPHSFILVVNCRLATRLTRKGSVMKQASEHQLSLPPVDSGDKIHVKLLLTCGKDNTRRYFRWTVEM